LALVAAFILLMAGTGPAGAVSGDGAQVAKAKKCAKKPATESRKKKGKGCKKAKKQKPLVRATLTWTGAGSADADLDLYVFAQDFSIAGEGTSSIVSTKISPDQMGPAGTEIFTDLRPKPLRAFSYGVCYTVGGSVHAPFTVTYVTADGQSHTETRDPGSSFHYDLPGGPAIPAGYCPSSP
jgi:hypothetical protein